MIDDDFYGDNLDIFINLIGFITLILQYDSFSENFEDYNNILNKILQWAKEYEDKRTLSFINNNDLINAWKLADDLQTKYICNDNVGSESEFSDYVVNFLWALRANYKKCVEGEMNYSK